MGFVRGFLIGCGAALWLVGGAPASQDGPKAGPEESPAEDVRLELARELNRLSGTDRTIEDVIVQLTHQQLVIARNLLPDLGDPQIEELREIMLEEFRAGAGSLSDELARTAERVFSAAELRGLIEFYRSPLGRRYVEGNVELSREAFVLTQRWAARASQETMRRAIERFQRETADESL